MTAADRTHGAPIEWPAPWWYRFAVWLLSTLAPQRSRDEKSWWCRCREIPEPTDPDRVLLRQVALVKRYVYLQQFASAEDPQFMHSHPYRLMIAIGLWGSYLERRIAGRDRRRRAPYLYVMDGGHVHHVQEPARGHTSIFVGLGREEDGSQGDKRYYGIPRRLDGIAAEDYPGTTFRTWQDHIRRKVARL